MILRKNFIFCVHAHQPVGNFDHVIRQAYEKSYKPFFDVVERHPQIPIVCHFSGSLVDWLVDNAPDFLNRVSLLREKGQLEILGSAYYEPIYGLIPERDLKGQLELGRNKLKKCFGVEARGVWLTERVWDPDIADVLTSEKIRYTVLDDEHFYSAGVNDPVSGCFLHETVHGDLNLFASLKALRYMIPFQRPETVTHHLIQMKQTGENCIVFADDCEKFGLWPGTHNWVYERGWLDKFFDSLEKRKDKINVTTFSRYLDERATCRKIHVPASSYSEMMQWSGGGFYNFFKRYDESCYMKDRMLGVSSAIDKAESQGVDSELIERAKDYLYKAQCNCAYWHGVFGGLYLHHLRSAVFENLLKAEQCLDYSPASMPSGYVALQTDKIRTIVNLGYGASVAELDYLPKNINLTCNLKRSPEAYHSMLRPGLAKLQGFSIHSLLGVREKGLEKHLHTDRFNRYLFLDHAFSRNVSLEEFKACSLPLCGRIGDIEVSQTKKNAEMDIAATFVKTASVQSGAHEAKICIEKKIKTTNQCLTAEYTLSTQSSEKIEFVMGVELNFSIGESLLRQPASIGGIYHHVFHDEWRHLDITMDLSHEFEMLACPVETISGSEFGLERTYQCLGVLLQRRVALSVNEQESFEIRLGIDKKGIIKKV